MGTCGTQDNMSEAAKLELDFLIWRYMINKRPEIISLTNKALERIKFIMSKAPKNTLELGLE